MIAFLILGLQRFGFRPLEAVIAAFVGVIGICYLGELWLAHPPLGTVAKHAVVPQFQGNESLLLAVGILGATVMPHVIYLHSALTQHRIVPRNDDEARRLYVHAGRRADRDGDRRPDQHGDARRRGDRLLRQRAARHRVARDAHRTLEPILGGASSALFALALIASGLSSSTVGTMSGQVVMQGFIRRQIPLWVRRLVTMIPAFVVIAIGVDPSRTLVLSQVVLSFGIPFALIPLVMFTSSRDIMGVLVNRRITTAAAALIAAHLRR